MNLVPGHPEWKRTGSGSIRLLAVLSIWMLGAADPVVAEGTGEAGPGSRGKWAIQLQVGYGLAVVGLQGSGVSVQRAVGERFAMRVGLGVDATTSHTQSSFVEEFYRTESNAQTYRLAWDLLRLPPPHDGVRFYWGAGPLGFWGRSRGEQEVFSDGVLQRTLKLHGKAWGLGGTAILGAEWLPRGNVGVIAEYGATLQYTEATARQEYSLPSPVKGTTRSKSWEFDLARARLGLSLYF
ncbi:MAG TPA: hypothetical protein VGK93_04415 [Candidatus Eisenbacteria bacterium]|jgi:hypothetical protein